MKTFPKGVDEKQTTAFQRPHKLEVQRQICWRYHRTFAVADPVL
jgi:hypothetical protein